MLKAIDAFQQTLRIDPLHADARINLGVAYRQSGQPAKAIEIYQSALKANPKIAGRFDYWVNYAAAQDKAGQFEKAIGTYTLALELNPNDAYSWAGIGLLWMQAEKYDEASVSNKPILLIEAVSTKLISAGLMSDITYNPGDLRHGSFQHRPSHTAPSYRNDSAAGHYRAGGAFS